MKPIAYEGKENYAFISYSHQDSEKVLGIVQALTDKGIRVWYDDGISPGSEWPENIARHLDDCRLFLAFLTDRYMESANCKRELTYALNRRKDFIAIFLEETNISPGMELQLSVQQNMLFYQYPSVEHFITRIMGNDVIGDCIAPVEPEEDIVVPQKAKHEITETIHNTSMIDSSTKESPSKEEKKGGKAKFAILGVAIVAVLAVGTMLFSGSGSHNEAPKNEQQITEDFSMDLNKTSVSFINKTITDPMVDAFYNMPNLNTLSFKECTFELTKAIEYERLNIKDLSFVDCPSYFKGPKSTIPYENETLKNLTIQNSEITDEDIKLFITQNLENVDISGNEGVSSLLNDGKPLLGDALQRLDISGTSIADLTPIANNTSLKKIVFNDTPVENMDALSNKADLQEVSGDRSNVTDITVLSTPENLASISFDSCKLKGLPESFESLRLKKIHLSDTGIKNINIFSDSTLLEDVDFSYNKITNVSFLKKSSEKLKYINLANTELSLNHLAFLKDCTKLKKLNLNKIYLKGNNIFEDFEDLEELHAEKCSIDDISFLESMPKISKIYLTGNRIKNLNSLGKIENNNYIRADFSNNQIKEISGDVAVPKYSFLNLEGNPLETISSNFLENASVNVLALNYVKTSDAETLKKSRIGRYYMIGIPKDKMVEYQDTMKSKLTIFDDEETLNEQMNEEFR